MSELQVDAVVDTRGQNCPMPIMNSTRAMRELEVGQVIKLMATDKGAKSDVPAWAESNGHEVIESDTQGEVLTFIVRKGED